MHIFLLSKVLTLTSSSCQKKCFEFAAKKCVNLYWKRVLDILVRKNWSGSILNQTNPSFTFENQLNGTCTTWSTWSPRIVWQPSDSYPGPQAQYFELLVSSFRSLLWTCQQWRAGLSLRLFFLSSWYQGYCHVAMVFLHISEKSNKIVLYSVKPSPYLRNHQSKWGASFV